MAAHGKLLVTRIARGSLGECAVGGKKEGTEKPGVQNRRPVSFEPTRASRPHLSGLGFTPTRRMSYTPEGKRCKKNPGENPNFQGIGSWPSQRCPLLCHE